MPRPRIPERDQRIADWTRQGYSARRIAEWTGLSSRHVVRIRAQMGVAGPTPRRLTDDEVALAEILLVDGASIRDAARTIGCNDMTLHRRYPQAKWSRSQVGRWARYMAQVHQQLPGF